jgi:hypothetical protein
MNTEFIDSVANGRTQIALLIIIYKSPLTIFFRQLYRRQQRAILLIAQADVRYRIDVRCSTLDIGFQGKLQRVIVNVIHKLDRMVFLIVHTDPIATRMPTHALPRDFNKTRADAIGHLFDLQLDPHRRMIAGFLPAPHIPVDSGRLEAFAHCPTE